MIYEICVDSVAGVRAAKDAGADRVELCGDLLEGGITPSRGMIQKARSVGDIGLNVMIRPRGGDFLFDADEFAVMEADIDTAKTEGADGVVIGLLLANGEIDVARTKALIAQARPLSVTFHRAFDMTPNPFEALETLIGLGAERVLTSGQEASVLEGLPLVTELVRRAGERIIVMPGGGITARNVERIVSAARPREIHFAALETESSAMHYRRTHVFMGGELRPPEYDRLVTSQDTIRSVMAKGARVICVPSLGMARIDQMGPPTSAEIEGDACLLLRSPIPAFTRASTITGMSPTATIASAAIAPSSYVPRFASP